MTQIMLTQTERNVLDELIRGKSFFELSTNHKKLAGGLRDKKIINNFTFLLNTQCLKEVSPELGHYLILIDAFKAGLYNEIRLLLDKKNFLTSYRCVGEKDFACFFTGAENQLKDFLNEISQLFVRVNVNPKKLIQCLELKSYFMGGRFFDGLSPEMPKEQSAIADIEKYLDDYTKCNPKFLKEIEQHNILIGYKINYDFIRLKKLRTVIIIWSPVNIKKFFNEPDIIKDVLETYSFVRIIDGYGDTGDPETTYNDVANVIICEFDKLKDYSKWMDKFYDFSSEINCLTILIEDILFEKCMTISNFYEFEKLCQMYKCSTKGLLIGNPIFYSNEPDIHKEICVDLDVINRHGLICGIPNSGKTTTATLLAEEAKKEGIGVHIIDVERDDKFKKYKLIDNDKFIKGEISLENLKGEISRYDVKELNKEKRELIIIKLLEAFIKLPEINQMTHLLLIDEFNALKSANFLEKLNEAIDRVRKRGVSIWCMSQSLKHFEESELYNNLRNKIIHQLTEKDVPLLESIIKNYYINLGIYKYGFSQSILNLGKGQAYVIFVGSDNVLKQPIKLQVKKETS